MKTDFQYLRFEHIRDRGKTSVWSCKNRNSGDELGQVGWYSGWRQYIYSPTVQAVYSAGCLLDIAEFIKQLQGERK